MRVRLRSFVLSICLPVFLILALVHLSVFQMIHEVWQEADGDNMISVPNPKCPEQRSGYCILSNYQPAQAIVGYDDSITLTTQGTVAFLDHLVDVCERWKGPISVSVYVPGRDFPLAKQVIEALRSQRDCLRRWTSWHLIFDLVHPPTSQEMLGLATANDSLKVNSSYIDKHHLAYPINVARNVARKNAKTRYVLASDIELYPSKEIIPKFLDLVRRLKSQDPYWFAVKHQVFVLPVFEVTKSSRAPQTKSQLLKLVHSKQAVSFHKFMCNICHQIPQLQKWLGSNITDTGMNIFLSTKRNRKQKLKAWEPFFIGTNREPFFDERLTWNGKMNKMQVAYEMCLLDYDFHILDGAFLTHAPGIKVFSHKEQAPRAHFMVLNNKSYKIILKELHDKYGDKGKC